MHSIPTTYRGVRYRSRLEARWASFFDALGWTHHYEPLDLAGWIPDFALELPGHPSTLVECKPALTMAELRAHAGRADSAPESYDCALLGSVLHWRRDHGSTECLVGLWGLFADERVWGSLCVTRELGGWGLHDADTALCGADVLFLGAAWDEAGNATQWNRPR